MRLFLNTLIHGRHAVSCIVDSEHMFMARRYRGRSVRLVVSLWAIRLMLAW